MLVSGQLFHNIRQFNVLPPNELSDHSLISTSIETNYNFLHREKYKTTPSPGKYLWNNESKASYLNALQDNEAEQQISNLNKLVDSSNVDTNILVDRLTNIYITAADKAIIFRKSQLPSKRKCKKKPNWVNKDCLILRKEVRNLGQKITKNPNNCALKQAYVTAKRTYNRLRKTLRTQFFNSLANEINSLNPNNSRQFWNKLKESKAKSVDATTNSTSDFVDHYKSLLNMHNPLEDRFDQKIDNQSLQQNNPLDYPFTSNLTKSNRASVN